MRLIDQLRAGEYEGAPWMSRELRQSYKDSLAPALREAVVYDITNVCEYLMSGTDQEHWGAKDFPCMAPPFETFWLEMDRPTKIVSEQYGVQDAAKLGFPKRWGFLFRAVDMDKIIEATQRQVGRGQITPQVRDARLAFVEKWRLRWALDAVIYLLYEGESRPHGPIASWTIYVSEDGTMPVAPEVTTPRDENLPGWVLPPEHLRQGITELWACMYPAMLAVSFMHCRNVRREEGPLPPRQQRRAFARKHPTVPVDKHYVLQIDPMKRVLETAERESRERGEGGGLARALHIARGHFKQFTEERPLFGKWAGRYWWPMHARGSRAAGTVEKEFTLAPQKRAPTGADPGTAYQTDRKTRPAKHPHVQ